MMHSDLKKLEEKTEKVLFSCQTVFPFTIFPTKLELTPTRLTIKRAFMPFSYRETPVFIKDIAMVKLDETPFFSTLSFEMKSFPDDPRRVRFLHPADARKMEDLIIGCLEAIREDVPPEESTKPDERLEKIGKSKEI